MLTITQLKTEARRIENELKSALDEGHQSLVPHLTSGISAEYFFSGGGQLTEHPYYHFGYRTDFPRQGWDYSCLIISVSLIRMDEGPKIFGSCHWEWPIVRLKENNWLDWAGQSTDLKEIKGALPQYFRIAMDLVKRQKSETWHRG